MSKDTSNSEASTPDVDNTGELRTMSGQEELALGEAMQDVWNDRCIDIGEVPTCFDIKGPRTTRITADFIGSAFVRDIVETMKSRGFSIQPAPAPSERNICDSCGEYQDECACKAPSERPTPRTDAAANECGFATNQYVHASHARTLERELADTETEFDKLQDALSAEISEVERLKRELAEAREQRAQLAETLVSLVAVARRYLPDYDEHPEIQKADEALAAVKGGPQ